MQITNLLFTLSKGVGERGEKNHANPIRESHENQNSCTERIISTVLFDFKFLPSRNCERGLGPDFAQWLALTRYTFPLEVKVFEAIARIINIIYRSSVSTSIYMTRSFPSSFKKTLFWNLRWNDMAVFKMCEERTRIRELHLQVSSRTRNWILTCPQISNFSLFSCKERFHRRKCRYKKETGSNRQEIMFRGDDNSNFFSIHANPFIVVLVDNSDVRFRDEIKGEKIYRKSR